MTNFPVCPTCNSRENFKMKNVKMDPPYETFETKQAVVDVMK